MVEYIQKVRAIGGGLQNAILASVVLYEQKGQVVLSLITDKTFTEEEKNRAEQEARAYVPERFACRVEIAKLSPDADMVKAKIQECIQKSYQAVAAIIEEKDIHVEKTEVGFYFTISVMGSLIDGGAMAKGVIAYLKKNFCGNFNGECVRSEKSIEDIEVEEEHKNEEYEIPIRSFSVCNFEPIESEAAPTTAIYMADLNFASEKVVVCGKISSITERTYTKNNGQEKQYLMIMLTDGSATMRVTYFIRQKSADKIRTLKEGDSIVCTGKTELYNGTIRYTAVFIDRGTVPDGFVPEARKGKPCPKYYETVFPQPFVDVSQEDMFNKKEVPQCLKGRTFVVFDLETTGLCTTNAAGNMDRIIEIGAFKIIDGEIKESFTTFINPQRKLSDEIIKLTGIDDDMVKDAPIYEKVMPDFFKFCEGSYLVGHNIAGFDFKFVDFYCSQCGYMLERKLMDTLTLAQSQLFLSNYKLNTVADYFGITFNHHRAIDDALATAKIFLELIALKKSLPNAC
jgi:DNA polymerase III epsilon subunit family exonuclease